MSKPIDFYWENVQRTVAEMKLHATMNKFSCAHQPLVAVPLDYVVLDELHLML